MEEQLQSPLLYVQIALALAGFEMPQEEPNDDDQQADFEVVYEAGDDLNLSVSFLASIKAFNLEVRLPPGTSAATQRAGLLLARTVDDLRCTIEPLNERFCLTRRLYWSSTIPVEDFAAFAAELVAAGEHLTQAGDAPTAPGVGLSGADVAAMRA